MAYVITWVRGWMCGCMCVNARAAEPAAWVGTICNATGTCPFFFALSILRGGHHSAPTIHPPIPLLMAPIHSLPTRALRAWLRPRRRAAARRAAADSSGYASGRPTLSCTTVSEQ
eukprot:2319617-Prymnesium_polylepis.1